MDTSSAPPPPQPSQQPSQQWIPGKNAGECVTYAITPEQWAALVGDLTGKPLALQSPPPPNAGDWYHSGARVHYAYDPATATIAVQATGHPPLVGWDHVDRVLSQKMLGFGLTAVAASIAAPAAAAETPAAGATLPAAAPAAGAPAGYGQK